jgi:phage terminase large subunit-like protein
LLHLCGPESVENTQLPSTAQSKEQAAVLFKLAAKIVRMSPTLAPPLLVVRDTVKEIYCPARGTLYKALSAEASTAHGQSPIFAVHDELGQVKGPVSELYNAIENAMGAHEHPLSIIISTQAATDADLLSVLIDDALASADPRIVVILYTADMSIDPFSIEAIRQANPAFGDFLNADELKDQAKKAKRMRSLEPLYRNYTLNQRVEMRSPFVSRSLWQERQYKGVFPTFSGHDVYGGLDLSEVNDLTALLTVAEIDGQHFAKSKFWLPEDGLRERAQRDRVPYDVWAKEGFITLCPGASINYDFVAREIAKLFGELEIGAIGFDRWNWRHFKPCLERAGLSEWELEKFIEVGQGFQSMSPALRQFESALLDGRFHHDGNPALTMCAANAVVQTDPAGNRKLTKQKSHGRIDGMVAAAITYAVMPDKPQGVDMDALLSAPAVFV